jgi:DNA repair protein RadC
MVAGVIRENGVTLAECPACDHRFSVTTPRQSGYAVRAPRDIYVHVSSTIALLEREEMHVLILNAKNVVLKDVTVYQGNVSAAIVRIAELFREAVKLTAAGIVLVHNHPSGDPEPSPDDLHLTAEAVAAGRLLDIPVLDHVIVARDGYVSLRDRGVSFDRGISTRASEVTASYSPDTYQQSTSRFSNLWSVSINTDTAARALGLTGFDTALPLEWTSDVFAKTGYWAQYHGFVWCYAEACKSYVFGHPHPLTAAAKILLDFYDAVKS